MPRTCRPFWIGLQKTPSALAPRADRALLAERPPFLAASFFGPLGAEPTASTALGLLSKLGPAGGQAEPLVLVQRAGRLLRKQVAFLRFLAELFCIGVGHGAH